MTNKEFQEILAKYPDDYVIQMDNSFGWEVPSSKHIVDPHLYVNTDFGFIEIEPSEIRDIWVNPENEFPEDGQEVIVLADIGMMQVAEIVVYNKDKNIFVGEWDYYDDCETTYKPEDVIAWMIIPKFENDVEEMP